MEKLIKSGFAFFAFLSDDKIIMENKFTGLRVLFDDSSKTWSVMEEG